MRRRKELCKRSLPMGRESVSLDAGAAGAGPKTRIVVERPAPGLARGKFAWPPWGIGVVGGLIIAVAIGYFIVRWRRRR